MRCIHPALFVLCVSCSLLTSPQLANSAYLELSGANLDDPNAWCLLPNRYTSDCGSPTWYVYAATVYNGELVIGGNFRQVGGVTCNYIARWDGTSWQPLGDGTNGDVYALTVWNNMLIAGGSFTTAGGATRNRIAAWNGTAWSTMSSLNNTVYALTLNPINGELIAGGAFTQNAAGNTLNRIARWQTSDSTWRSVPGSGTVGVNNTVYALTAWNGMLIAGGSFTSAGGATRNRIAAWNGTAWEAVGAGMDQNTVYALTSWDPDGDGPLSAVLVAGGSYTSIGTVPYGRIAGWDGTAWATLGSGMDDNTVYALTPWDPDGDGPLSAVLVAGGSYTSIGTVPYGRIAGWDGTAWATLGSGMDSDVRALTIYNSGLVAGGSFTTAGDVACNRIAGWDGTAWAALGSGIETPSPFLPGPGDYAFVRNGQNLTLNTAFPNSTASWVFGGWDVRNPAEAGGTLVTRNPVTLTVNYPGSFTTTAGFEVGSYYDGTMIQNSGAVTSATFTVGNNGATGRYELKGGTLKSTAAGINIGANGGHGVVEQTGGTFEGFPQSTSGGSLNLGTPLLSPSSLGEYYALGGTLNAGRFLNIVPCCDTDYLPNTHAVGRLVVSQDAEITAPVFNMWGPAATLELIVNSDRDFRIYFGGPIADGNSSRISGNLVVTLADGFQPYYGQRWQVLTSLGSVGVGTSKFLSITSGYTVQATADNMVYLYYTGGQPCSSLPGIGDGDGDRDVDQADFGLLQACYTGLPIAASDLTCKCLDLIRDGIINQDDFDAFEASATGPGVETGASATSVLYDALGINTVTQDGWTLVYASGQSSTTSQDFSSGVMDGGGGVWRINDTSTTAYMKTYKNPPVGINPSWGMVMGRVKVTTTGTTNSNQGVFGYSSAAGSHSCLVGFNLKSGDNNEGKIRFFHAGGGTLSSWILPENDNTFIKSYHVYAIAYMPGGTYNAWYSKTNDWSPNQSDWVQVATNQPGGGRALVDQNQVAQDGLLLGAFGAVAQTFDGNVDWVAYSKDGSKQVPWNFQPPTPTPQP